MEQYIGFHLHTGEYAIPIMKVREIISLPTITKIPQSPSYLKGITNLRGSVIPVVNLKQILCLPEEEKENAKVIVIASGRITFGLLVDGIAGVTSIDESAVESPENLPHGHGDQVLGVAKMENRLIVLLDIKKLIPLDDMTLLEDYAAEVVSDAGDGKVSVTRSIDSIGGRMQVKELRDAQTYFEKTKAISPDDPRHEIAQCMIDFITAVSENNFETADLAMQKLTKGGQGDLFQEVGKITRRLHDSVKSFKEAIDPTLSEMAKSDIPSAVDKLQYVIEKTEEAANKTMSVVEKYTLSMDDLSAHLRKVTGPPETIEYLKKFRNGFEDDLTEILTTQSFQDLTGQTIKKVIMLVNDLEAELVRLITMYGVKLDQGKEPVAVAERVSQSGVDDLLKDLGF
jgi:chemotaxis signal transduction protein/chemotaxis regulatin CheY-phosphate phosphatase CheZ